MPCNFESVKELLAEVREKYKHIKIWLYTGYVYEELSLEHLQMIHSCVDVLVDGPYVEELRDTSLPYRGSSNQRIIEITIPEN